MEQRHGGSLSPEQGTQSNRASNSDQYVCVYVKERGMASLLVHPPAIWSPLSMAFLE